MDIINTETEPTRYERLQAVAVAARALTDAEGCIDCIEPGPLLDDLEAKLRALLPSDIDEPDPTRVLTRQIEDRDRVEMQFLGWLAIDIPALRETTATDLIQSWDRFKARRMSQVPA